MSMRSAIASQFQQVASEQERTLSPLSDDLKLLQSGLDSLSFAIIVARLEDSLGIDPFRSAEDLFQFVSKNMPRAPQKPGSLQPEEYWAIINFMLIAHGVSHGHSPEMLAETVRALVPDARIIGTLVELKWS